MNEQFKIQAAERMGKLPRQFFATLVAKAEVKTAQGNDVINLGQGNPDQPTPIHIVEAMQKATAEAQHHRYAPFSGYRFLKEAVACFYDREYQVNVDPNTEVAILFGGKSGLIEVAQCLLNPGDTCLVPDPGYPDYWSGIALAEARMEMMPLTATYAFLPNYGQIPKEALRAAKMMFLNYPNNPTGATAELPFFQQTVELAKQHEIAIVHDFAYGAIGFDQIKPPSFLQAEGAKEIGIEIYTLSKTYNMAGWRVAFAVGNAEIIRLINLLQDHQFVSLFGAIQKAAAVALTNDQACVQALLKKYEARRNHLFAELQRIGWQAEKPGGSFFSWLPVPCGFSSVSLADRLLEEANIVVAPGVGFGEAGEGYVRVGLLSDEERLTEAVNRIARLNLFG